MNRHGRGLERRAGSQRRLSGSLSTPREQGAAGSRLERSPQHARQPPRARNHLPSARFYPGLAGASTGEDHSAQRLTKEPRRSGARRTGRTKVPARSEAPSPAGSHSSGVAARAQRAHKCAERPTPARAVKEGLRGMGCAVLGIGPNACGIRPRLGAHWLHTCRGQVSWPRIMSDRPRRSSLESAPPRRRRSVPTKSRRMWRRGGGGGTPMRR